MSAFFEWLEEINAGDRKVRAVLRRSLAFAPASYVPAYPYVEPFLREESGSWRRQMYYLAAGLWAAHWREERSGEAFTLGRACAEYQRAKGSASTERRFINVLDAEPDQLPYRLRQLIALLNERSLDFDSILTGLLYWNDDERRTQNRWARDFYRELGRQKADESSIEEESTT